jgi:hypothetical protein
VIGTVAKLAGEVPESIDSANAQQIVLGLMALCVVGVFLVFRTIQKAMVRVLLLAILLAVGAGLWVQREQLQDCAGQCSCHVFGRDVTVTDAAGVCR